MSTTADYSMLNLNGLVTTSGPPPPITTTLINEAIKNMKFCKATGPSGIVAEMLAASGEKGVDLLTRFTECVFSNGVISYRLARELYTQSL